jgi:hypothetical protein
VLKRELEPPDRMMLDAAGFIPSAKGRRVWPQLRSMGPGRYPWHATAAEVETVLFALPRVAAAARLTGENPEIWDAHCEGEIAIIPDGFYPERDALRPQDIDWQPMIPLPEPEPAPVVLDEAIIAELSKLPTRRGVQFEVDVCYSGAVVVAERDGPRMPKLAMVVERNTGLVGGFHLSETSDKEGSIGLGAALAKAMKQLGRPERLIVQRPRVAAMLKRAAAELNLPIFEDVELEALTEAKESMEDYMRSNK